MKKQKSALECAVDTLAAHPCSVSEIRKKLFQKKSYAREEIEHAISECLRFGFLNDRTYAETVVSSFRSRGYGDRRIAVRLREKGVAGELAQEAIQAAGVGQEEDPAQRQKLLAEIALKRRLRSLNAVEDKNRRKAKAMRFLAGRGFAPEAIYSAVNALLKGSLEEEQLDPDDENAEESEEDAQPPPPPEKQTDPDDITNDSPDNFTDDFPDGKKLSLLRKNKKKALLKKEKNAWQTRKNGSSAKFANKVDKFLDNGNEHGTVDETLDGDIGAAPGSHPVVDEEA